MHYGLGIDLGTTQTAAAVRVDGRIEIVRLGGRRAEIPSLVFVRPDGSLLIGEAAERRGQVEPGRLAREFKRRIGDPVPILAGGVPFSAHALTAKLLRHVLDAVIKLQDGPPAVLTVTHPANWGPYKREQLDQALRLADTGPVLLRTEPEAAALQHATARRIGPGETVAVYDLGGGTFDAAVLRREGEGFQLLGDPEGIEQLGGADFDEAVFGYVLSMLGNRAEGLDPNVPEVVTALARLRRDCVEAKEALSFDTEVMIPVALPGVHTRVRLNRSELESMIAPALADTVAAMHRALRAARVAPEELDAVLLAGGSSRIPLVSQLLSTAFDRPVVADPHPEHSIAMGAAVSTVLITGGVSPFAEAVPPPPHPDPQRKAAAEPRPAPDAVTPLPRPAPDTVTASPDAVTASPRPAADTATAAPRPSLDTVTAVPRPAPDTVTAAEPGRAAETVTALPGPAPERGISAGRRPATTPSRPADGSQDGVEPQHPTSSRSSAAAGAAAVSGIAAAAGDRPAVGAQQSASSSPRPASSRNDGGGTDTALDVAAGRPGDGGNTPRQSGQTRKPGTGTATTPGRSAIAGTPVRPASGVPAQATGPGSTPTEVAPRTDDVRPTRITPGNGGRPAGPGPAHGATTPVAYSRGAASVPAKAPAEQHAVPRTQAFGSPTRTFPQSPASGGQVFPSAAAGRTAPPITPGPPVSYPPLPSGGDDAQPEKRSNRLLVLVGAITLAVIAGTTVVVALTKRDEQGPTTTAQPPASSPVSAPPYPTDTMLIRVDTGGDDRPERKSGVFLLTPGQAGRTPISDTGGDVLPEWSRDRKRIALTRYLPDGSNAIWVMDADGSNSTKVVGDVTDGRVAWSSDGTKLAFMREVGGSPQIFVITIGESEPRQLTRAPGKKDDPAWSPDGETMAYWAYEGGERQIFLLSVDDPQEPGLQITDGESGPGVDPAWSPDGSTIAYTHSTGKDVSDIWLVGSDGENAKRLTDHKAREMDPSWAPKGKWLAFTRGPLDKPKIVIVKEDGSTEKTLTANGRREGHPCWS